MGNFSTDEILDVLSPDGSVIGTAPRKDVHQQGLWHRTFHCLVVRAEEPVRVVFQRRSAESAFANKIDFTASGHLRAGEKPRDGVRELEEETGLRVKPEDLTPVGVQLIVDHRGDVKNQEQVHVFFLANDLPLDQFNPDPAEVQSLIEIEAEPMLRLLDPDDSASVAVGSEHGGGTTRPVRITADDLISDYDQYLAKTLIMAQRFVAGQRPLAL